MRKVLVVDDDTSILQLVRDLLAEYDIKDVLTVTTAKDAAITYARTQDIDLVISDLGIGKEKGDVFHRNIRPLLEVRKTKFIVMSCRYTDDAIKYFAEQQITCLDKTWISRTLPAALNLTHGDHHPFV